MRALLLCVLFLPLPLSAGLSFETKLKDVHAGYDQREVTCDFEFSNDTDGAITIARYESTCSCMNVKVKGGKLRYEPGEKGTIRAIFDMGNFSGEVDKSVRLWLKGDPAGEPSITLTTRVHIPVLVEIEPKTVRWDVDAAGEPTTQVISIKMNHDKPIHVLSVEPGNQKFTTELKTLEKGKAYELHVTPLEVSKPALGVIQIRTDAESSRYSSQRAFALVRKPVEP
jgi:hypothetical protein